MIVLVIPVAAVLLALVWVRWLRQPEKPLETAAAIEAHRRSLDAIAPDEGSLLRREPQQPPTRMPSLR